MTDASFVSPCLSNQGEDLQLLHPFNEFLITSSTSPTVVQTLQGKKTNTSIITVLLHDEEE